MELVLHGMWGGGRGELSKRVSFQFMTSLLSVYAGADSQEVSAELSCSEDEEIKQWERECWWWLSKYVTQCKGLICCEAQAVLS